MAMEPELSDLESWENRQEPEPNLLQAFNEADYPDHHLARVECLNCGAVSKVLYPNGCNVLRMLCPHCGARETEVVKYLKRIWKQ